MIVKNEEKNIANCLESIKDFIDEIIIVDTGSTDKTVEICETFNAKIFRFDWNN
ncbi:glycosyltransferase, partial [Bacillus cereus]|uniref:glycosyltransferase n=1 Tax=Bacillus cereus TaxID=1396 RepID=UPI000C006C2B